MEAEEPYRYRGIPLGPAAALPLIKDVMAKESPIVRGTLVRRVVDLHRQRGGRPSSSEPARVIKKALTILQTTGEVVSVSHGYWRLATQGEIVPVVTDDELEAGEDDEDTDPEPLKLKVECEIGTGPHVVYVYYQETDKRLAKYENRPTWPCKVGFTTGSVEARIIGQGSATAMHSLPVIGLLIRTDNGSRTEKVIHDALRLAGRALPNSPQATGTEWFNTTPDAVRQWFESYQSSLRLLIPNQPQAEQATPPLLP